MSKVSVRCFSSGIMFNEADAVIIRVSPYDDDDDYDDDDGCFDHLLHPSS